jgi:3-oxoadipate enol-lactonase
MTAPEDQNQDQETIFHYLDFNPDGSPPVLLLHGLGADSTSWGYQIPVLSEVGLRPIVPDLPGFGKSIAGNKHWTISTAANDVAKMIQKLVEEPVIAVGISMGGTVALQLVLDYPHLIKRLVLISTFARLRPKRFDEMSFLLGRYAIAQLRGKEYQAGIVARRMFPRPDQEYLRNELIHQILQSNENVYRQAMQSLALFNVKKRLPEIMIPTLVISGENDSTVPIANQVELAGGIRGAKHVIIPDAGHAVIVDQVARFNSELLNFIKGSQAGL